MSGYDFFAMRREFERQDALHRSRADKHKLHMAMLQQATNLYVEMMNAPWRALAAEIRSSMKGQK